MLSPSVDRSLSPYDARPYLSLDDKDGARRGLLELRFVLYGRKGAPRPETDAPPKIETAVVLTRVTGYGTADIARRIADVNFTLMQKYDIAEILTLHHWLSADGYALKANTTMFEMASHPLMRRRLREVRILCGRGLFAAVIDSGLRLSGLTNARVMHDEGEYLRDVDNILRRYDARTTTERLPVSPEMFPIRGR